MYNEEPVRLSLVFPGGSERSTPPNPQETPRQPPGNPQESPRQAPRYIEQMTV